MTIKNLPIDCLNLMFEHLRDSIPTLYNCLFINKIWCQNAIPILWRYPENYCEFSMIKRKIWLLTLLKCLPDDDYDDNSNTSANATNSSKLPLFNYVEYIKSLSVQPIILTFNELINENLIIYDKTLIFQRLIKTIIKYSKIQMLDIHHFSKEYSINILKIASFDSYSNSSNNCFKDLSEFQCSCEQDSINSKDFFFRLSKISKKLQKIIIKKCGIDNEGLAELIRVQSDLKYFEISSTHDYEKFKKIGNSLSKHKNSLLEFINNDGISISPKIIGNFINLKRLKIKQNSTRILKQDFDKFISSISIIYFENLEIFEFSCYFHSYFDELKEFIKRNRNRLRSISYYYEERSILNSNVNIDLDEFEIFLKSIIKNCLNLEYFYINYKNSIYQKTLEDSFFFDLFKSCKKLRGLALINIKDKIIIDDNFLNILIDTLSNNNNLNLNHLILFCQIDFNLIILKKLFESWKIFNKHLTLEVLDAGQFNQEIYEFIRDINHGGGNDNNGGCTIEINLIKTLNERKFKHWFSPYY